MASPYEGPGKSAGPDKKDRKRPVELLIFSGALAVFAGLVVLGATREPMLALIFFGLAFIVSLVILAMLALAVKPTGEERADLAEQDSAEQGGPTGNGPTNPEKPRGH